MDLKQLATLALAEPPRDGIWAPAEGEGLVETVMALRARGERVVQALPGQRTGPEEHRCDRQLVLRAGQWQAVTL